MELAYGSEVNSFILVKYLTLFFFMGWRQFSRMATILMRRSYKGCCATMLRATCAEAHNIDSRAVPSVMRELKSKGLIYVDAMELDNDGKHQSFGKLLSHMLEVLRIDWRVWR